MDKERTVRLACPTCDAVYEVPAGAIPAGGRDVQCSNCGTVWFQPLDGPPAPPSSAHMDRQPRGADRAGERDIPRPPLSEEGRRILVEEAERERTLRRGGTAPDPSAPDEAGTSAAEAAALAAAVDTMLGDARTGAEAPGPAAGRDGAVRERDGRGRDGREREGRERAADGMRDEGRAEAARARAERRHEALAPLPPADPEDIAAPDRPSRRDRLPDIAEINSSLDGDGSPDSGDAGGRGAQAGGGFRTGFAAALVIAAAGLVVYVQGDSIAAAVPALEGPITAYRATVNDWRIALDGFARQAARTLEP